MGTEGTARPSWLASHDQSATFVELFFDLVFVFAITKITYLLAHDLTWVGAAHAALILWMVWWAWTQFTWTLNPANTDHGPVRIVTLVATAAAFFLAEAVPDAFGSTGIPFALAYVVVRCLGIGLFFFVSTGDENRRAIVGFAAWSIAGLAAVLVGAFLASPLRELCWLVAILLDLFTVWRAGDGDWTVHTGHFTERHGLIVIIALGESLIATGNSLASLERGATFYAISGTAVALVCALWWTYFGRARAALEEWLAGIDPRRRGHLARDHYSLAHVFLVGGVIAIAVALEEAVGHPGDPLGTAGLLALGTGILFYLGTIVFGLRRSGESIWPWYLTMAAVPLCLWALRTARPVTVLAAVASVLVLLSWMDARSAAEA